MSSNRKNQKRAMIIGGSLLGILVVGSSSVLLGRYLDREGRVSKIYGTWVEQGVPAYLRDSMVIRKEGVYIDQRIVDTDFNFDGHTLTYIYQGDKYKYVVKDENVTVLERVAPLHYKSLFQLSGGHVSE